MADQINNLSTWPANIWLQWNPDELEEYPGASEDLTWSDSNVHKSDVAYVRADLAAAPAVPAVDALTDDQIDALHHKIEAQIAAAIKADLGSTGGATIERRMYIRAILAHPADAGAVAVEQATDYELAGYQPGQWWLVELEKHWGHGEDTPDTRRAAKVACDFAKAVFADRQPHPLEATSEPCAAQVPRDWQSVKEVLRRAGDVLEGLEGMRLPGAMPVRAAKLKAAVDDLSACMCLASLATTERATEGEATSEQTPRTEKIQAALSLIQQDYGPDCLQMASTQEYVADAVSQLIAAGYEATSERKPLTARRNVVELTDLLMELSGQEKCKITLQYGNGTRMIVNPPATAQSTGDVPQPTTQAVEQHHGIGGGKND